MTRWAVLAAMLPLAMLAACTGTTSGSPLPRDATTKVTSASTAPPRSSAPPSRPRQIRLDGRDPCTLVPETDFAKFHIEKPGLVQQSPTFKSPRCLYTTNVGSFAVTLVVTEGIEAWTNGTRNADLKPAKPIEGFPAITLGSKVDDQRCNVAVDVATGQYVLTDVGVIPGEEPKLPEKCEYAHQLAASAMRTLVRA
jgi:hypothetical protein